MLFRISLSIAVLLAVAAWEIVLGAGSTVMLGRAAGDQFSNSDTAYVGYLVSSSFWKTVGVPSGAAFLCLLAIWWRPMKHTLLAAAVVSLAGLAFSHNRAFAFAETTDRTEIKTILPNESAFWIPDTGANKDSQARFDSEEYLNANKVASKRFEIPHTKLYGTGGKSLLSGWDLYVPTGRLIIVPRTPYSHEWVDAADRGSSARREGFPCQSQEGLDMTMGVSIGTSVSENQAARFLYNFGVQQPQLTAAQRDDPQVIFQSVYYGKSLDQVMNEYGRKKVQTLVCNEVMGRKFDDVNHDMVKIMESVEKQSRQYFESVGITLNFIGWGDTATFSADVQAAVNRRYIAGQDAAAAALLQPYLETVRSVAEANALRDFVNKGTALPSTVVGDAPSFLGMLGGLKTAPRAGAGVQMPVGLQTPPAR